MLLIFDYRQETKCLSGLECRACLHLACYSPVARLLWKIPRHSGRLSVLRASGGTDFNGWRTGHGLRRHRLAGKAACREPARIVHKPGETGAARHGRPEGCELGIGAVCRGCGACSPRKMVGFRRNLLAEDSTLPPARVYTGRLKGKGVMSEKNGPHPSYFSQIDVSHGSPTPMVPSGMAMYGDDWPVAAAGS